MKVTDIYNEILFIMYVCSFLFADNPEDSPPDLNSSGTGLLAIVAATLGNKDEMETSKEL